MDIKLKTLLQSFAEEVLNVFDFSLIATNQKFLQPDELIEKLGGGIEYRDFASVTEVCRCGNGFIVHVQKEKDLLKQLCSVAEALAILFLKMSYEIDDEKFHNMKNMEYQNGMGSDFEEIQFLAHELLIPKKTLKLLTEKHLDAENRIHMNGIADDLGFSTELNFALSIIETRLLETRMIKSRWD